MNSYLADKMLWGRDGGAGRIYVRYDKFNRSYYIGGLEEGFKKKDLEVAPDRVTGFKPFLPYAFIYFI